MTTTMIDMHGKRVMVTGATDGIGKATALALAKLGAEVIVVGRNAHKITATIDEISRESGNRTIDGLQADFASLAQIRQLAATFGERYDHLDVLINNAGALFGTRSETVDGFERTFGVNHLAPFLLTNLLLDALHVGVKRTGAARIVNVSSVAHAMIKLNLDDLQSRGRYSGMRAYAQSKLANLLFTYELARRLAGTGITANALHPGIVASRLGHDQSGWAAALLKLVTRFGRMPTNGAETSVYLAASPEVAGVTGQYFVQKRPVYSSPASYNLAVAAQLWRISEELTGLDTARTQELAHLA